MKYDATKETDTGRQVAQVEENSEVKKHMQIANKTSHEDSTDIGVQDNE